MNNNISDLKLEQWLLGELSTEEAARIAAALEKDELLRARVDTMKEQSQDLLKRHPPEPFLVELNRKIHLQNAQERQRDSNRPSSFYWRIGAGTLAVATALLIALPLSNPTNESNLDDPKPGNGYRTKGETLHLMAHLIEEGKQKPLSNGDVLQQGDRIQLSIQQAKGRSFFIFSIDGNGVTSVHYPLHESPDLEQSDFFSLPTSYRLDDAPDFEHFYLLSSPRVLNKEDALSKVQQAQKDDLFQETLRSLLPTDVTINQLSFKKDR